MLHNHQQVPAEKTGQRGETTVLEIIAMIEKYIILSLKPIIYDKSFKTNWISVAFKQAIAAKNTVVNILKPIKAEKKQAFPVCMELKFQKTWISMEALWSSNSKRRTVSLQQK